MKVAVLGAGNGGCATAFDWAQHGHEVRLWSAPEFAESLDGIVAAGGLSATGDLTGTVSFGYVGTDIAKAVEGAELIFAVGPAYSTAAFASAVGPYLNDSQHVVVNPGSCAGSILFKHTLGVDLRSTDRRIAETSTLPYAVRLTGPAELTVYLRLKAGLYVASLPRSGTAEITEILQQVWPFTEAAGSVFQTTLQNGNPVIHPAVTLLNAGLLERTNGDFLFYEEGVTPGVGRLMEGVDKERMAIAEALGVHILSEPALGHIQGYMAVENYDTGYSTAPGFLGIAAQSQLDHRYLNEDVGFGLVFMSDLARHAGVPTPTMDAVIQVASVVMGRDYRAEGARTMASLGLGGYRLEELASL